MRQTLGLVLPILTLVLLWSTGLLYSSWQSILMLLVAALIVYFILDAFLPSKKGMSESGAGLLGAAAGIADGIMSDRDRESVTSDPTGEPTTNTGTDPRTSSGNTTHTDGGGSLSPSDDPGTSSINNEDVQDPTQTSQNSRPSLPSRGDSNLNEEDQSSTMSDFSRQLIQDLKDQINHLEKEEELEIEAVQEQRDAEQKLAEAMQGLNQERAVLEAIMYFNQINLDQPQGQIHSKVEKFIQQSNEIGSVNQLLREVEKVEEYIKEIEVAENEIKDSEGRMHQAVSDEEAVDQDMNEISQLMNQLQQGASKFQQWGLGRQ